MTVAPTAHAAHNTALGSRSGVKWLRENAWVSDGVLPLPDGLVRKPNRTAPGALDRTAFSFRAIGEDKGLLRPSRAHLQRLAVTG